MEGAEVGSESVSVRNQDWMLGGTPRGREWAGGPARPRTLHTGRARRGQASVWGAHPQRLEAGAAGGWDCARTKRRGTTRGRTWSGVPEWGARVGVLEKGGNRRAEGEGFAVFLELCEANCEVGAVSKTTLPADTTCKLEEVPQSTIRFRISLEGFTEHTVGCYTCDYGLQQGRDTD